MDNTSLSNIVKTLSCVAIARALFITSVFYSVKWLFIVVAFFDWLPLPTKWMKIAGVSSRETRYAGMLHGVVTVIAYVIGITWVFQDIVYGVSLGYVFLVVWFQAVRAGLCCYLLWLDA